MRKLSPPFNRDFNRGAYASYRRAASVRRPGRRPGATGCAATTHGRANWRKVPEITLYFWIIKVLCTTVGETAADFLNTNLRLGLTNTTYIMGSLLLITLFFQFRVRKYVPGIYWLAVVLISIVGTQITDNL